MSEIPDGAFEQNDNDKNKDKKKKVPRQSRLKRWLSGKKSKSEKPSDVSPKRNQIGGSATWDAVVAKRNLAEQAEPLVYELRGKLDYVKDDSSARDAAVPDWAEGRAPNEIPRGRFRNTNEYKRTLDTDAVAKLNNKKKDEEDLAKLRDDLLRGQGGK